MRTFSGKRTFVQHSPAVCREITGGSGDLMAVRSKIDLRPRRGRKLHYDEDQDEDDSCVEVKGGDVYLSD